MNDKKNNYYDVANQQKHDKNTASIQRALQLISDDYSLKPTVKMLSDLSGIHRNTLRNRGWPLEQLNKIKIERNKKTATEIKDSKTEIFSLEEILDNAKSELVYWFNKTKELESKNEQLAIKLTRTSNSRDYYQKEYEKESALVKSLKEKIEILSKG